MKLVVIMNDDIYTHTLAIAKAIGHTHETVIRLLRNSQDLPQLSDLKSESIKTKGRPSEIYYLTEEQSTLLVMLMKNTKKVRLFKSDLAKQFYAQRKIINELIIQKQNGRWLEDRASGKITRLEETDAIKKFVNYATEQGSKSAHMYYVTISKMENKALFFIEQKFDNLRDVMNLEQLDLIKIADKAIEISLEQSMSLQLPYKECYKKAKEKIEALATIIPRSPLPALLLEGQNNLKKHLPIN